MTTPDMTSPARSAGRPPSRPLSRRAFVAAAAGATAAVALPAWPERARAASATPVLDATPVLETHPDTEPSGTHLRAVNGTNVVFQYGAVLPGFDGWRSREATRDYLPLDGRWRFRFDPDNTGLDAGWQSPATDDSGWGRIGVPTAWDLLDTPDFGSESGTFGVGGAFNDGYAWYRRTVAVPATWDARQVRLNFLAVGYSAEVWLDGQFLGKHEGANSPFSLPLAGALRPGSRQLIAVRVFRRATFTSYTAADAQPVTDDKEIPYKPVDYWPYAGITRSAWLEAAPPVTVAKLLAVGTDGTLQARAVLENNGDADFDGFVSIDPGRGSGGRPVTTRASVPAHSASVVAASIDIPQAPHWSPASPRLLRARATVTDTEHGAAVDTLGTTYGLRDVTVSGTEFHLNGRPLFLKGMNWHEETAAHGRAMTVREYDTELGHLLDVGANFIRNSVYNRHPYVYDWADEHGVLVMDDMDTMWLNTAQEKLQTESYGLSRAMALTMAWTQQNHPSVVLWCLQNESEIDADGAPVYRAWLADLKSAVNAVDLVARPVTWASFTSDDAAFDLADVVGFNEYFGFFYGVDEDLGPTLDAVHAKYPDKPILITENGTWSIAGTHGSNTTQGTEEWQATSFEKHWAMVTSRSDFVAGYTFWLLKDYKERDGYNQNLNGISVLGMITFGEEKPKAVYASFQRATNPRD